VKEIVVSVPLLLARVGLRLQPQGICLLIAASAASFSAPKATALLLHTLGEILLTIIVEEEAYVGTY
jgi:hypothetical protein